MVWEFRVQNSAVLVKCVAADHRDKGTPNLAGSGPQELCAARAESVAATPITGDTLKLLPTWSWLDLVPCGALACMRLRALCGRLCAPDLRLHVGVCAYACACACKLGHLHLLARPCMLLDAYAPSCGRGTVRLQMICRMAAYVFRRLARRFRIQPQARDAPALVAILRNDRVFVRLRRRRA